MLRTAFVFGLLVLFSSIAQAGLFTIAGDTGDGGVEVNGFPVNLSDPDFRPGAGGNIIRGQAAIYFFALPTLSPAEVITNVELKFEYLGIYVDSRPSIPEFNLDLFGIDARPDPLIVASDYHDGNSSLSTDFLIEKSIITPATIAGTKSVTNAALFNFVRSLYDPSGVPAADFVAFRINPDKDLPNNSGLRRGYLVAMADYPDADFRPVLTITTVPEPTSILLLLVGGFLLVSLKSRVASKASPKVLV